MPANIYKLADGTRVPGCTTVCGQFKQNPSLMNWAHRIGFDGALELLTAKYPDLEVPDYEDCRTWMAERDSAGAKGTDVHDMISAFWRNEEVIMIGDIQTRSFKNFLKWTRQHTIVPVLVEKPLVSEKWEFGGQPDLLAIIDGLLTLPDVKTGKAVYDDIWYQVAGYDILLREHGWKPKRWAVLRLGKDGSWEYEVRTEIKRPKRIFKDLLDIYYQRK